MKLFKKVLMSLMVASLWSGAAFAFKADPLKGAYEIISQSSAADAQSKAYLIVDTDTLLNIWNKYGSGALPANLEKYKDEPTIIAGLTNQNVTLVSFEKNAVIGAGYLHLKSSSNELELARQPDGQFALGIVDNGALSKFVLAPAQPL